MSQVHRIKPGHKVNLEKIDPSESGGLPKLNAEEETLKLGIELSELLDLLYYAGTNGLLIVLQGMDTSGKDGSIRHILQFANAQSCRVQPFKIPTPDEMAHDFLWRVHKATPGLGEIAIFNRSHYEDVLVVRVHELAPKEVWSKRYDHINHFERLLVDSNTIILKYFLHIDEKEQEQRLLAREEEVEKSWKLSAGDWKERQLWKSYQKAYEEVLERCSTDEAPWHVVPANKKWYRDLAITRNLVDTLRPYKERWMEKLEAIGQARKKELAEFRAQK